MNGYNKLNILAEFEKTFFPSPGLPQRTKEEKNIYAKLYMKRYRILALKRIAGNAPIVCSGCGCNEIEFLEVNHNGVSGNHDIEYLNGKKNIPSKRTTIKFYIHIARGLRPINDLNIRCKLCNSLDLLLSKNIESAKKFKIEWRERT
jgi:hypothetical protein